MKRFFRSSRGQSFIAFVGRLYIQLVYRTSFWRHMNKEIPENYLQEKKPFIVAFWHGRLLMLCYSWRFQTPLHMLISAHHDGRIISKIISYFGIKTIDGSTRRGGMQALRKVVATLKKGGVVGFTPDGPRGPGEVASPGVVTAAWMAGADIIPLTFSIKRHKQLSTWDKFLIALPFSRGHFMWGPPIPAPATKEEIEPTRALLQEALRQFTMFADESL